MALELRSIHEQPGHQLQRGAHYIVPRSAKRGGSGRHAILVAAGILLSRLAGLVRQRVFSHYFGLSNAADAFNAAFRIPNLLQNLFGEGVLSASFIPVYSRLLADGEEEESRKVAGSIASILALITSIFVLAGVLITPFLIDLIAPGFQGEKRDLTIQLVRVLFPGAGLLALSAWCLGILNSHRKFFLSYASPVIWNAALVTTLIAFGRKDQASLAVILAWGSVAGSLLQFGIQLPMVLSLARGLRFRIAGHSEHVREVVRNFGPVFLSRGVVQISAYVDAWLASWLGQSAVSGLTSAQLLYTLPVSLFGMSVSAAELPAMSSAAGDRLEVADHLRERLNIGLRRIAFFIVPSAAAFLALGDVIAGALFQTGRFGRTDSLYVWGILAGSAFGLLPSTLGRLYASTYYALRDTRTPLRFAVLRVALATTLGYLFSMHLPKIAGVEMRWGVAGITIASAMAGWIEFILLRRSLNLRIGKTGLPVAFATKLWVCALAAAALGWLSKAGVAGVHPALGGAVVLAAYGLAYIVLTFVFRVGETAGVLRRFTYRR